MNNKKYLTIENCRIIFRNFSGKEKKFNPAGVRNFSVVLDAETAMSLKDDGFNIKERPPKDPQDELLYTLPVAVRYDNFPPNIYLICGKKKTLLDEDSVGSLDYATITNVDLTISCSHWETAAGSGIKAYVKSMYVTIERDELAAKYSEYDDDEDELPV